MTSPWIHDHRPGPLDAVDGLVLTCTATSPREIAMPWQQAAQDYCAWRRIPTALVDAGERTMPNDYNLTSDQLCARYGSWGSHPNHPVEDWQAEVADDETRLGYWDWLEQMIAIDQDDNETSAPAQAG